MILEQGQSVYIIPGGGRIVHLTPRCNYLKRAPRYESKSVNEIKAAVQGEPKVCSACVRIVKGS